jgi:hypothetical protein
MKKITLTINERTGTALVKWCLTDQWNDGHYEALITVPYKDSRWESLFIYDEEALDKALDKALQELKSALLHCGMCW